MPVIRLGSRCEGVPEGVPAEGRGVMHVPVLLPRCLELLGPALEGPAPVLLDATVGLGGHASAFLERYSRLTLIGLDRDREALALAADRLGPFGSRVELVHGRHVELMEALGSTGRSRVDAVLMDLGVSSRQIDTRERGFAYSYPAPLDMRMDPDDPITAADILRTYSARQIRTLLSRYGEEPHAARIAAEIVDARERADIVESTALVEIVRRAIPAAARRKGGNPAKRTFQALRIEVNGELTGLPTAVDQAISALVVGGRVAIISYHSLEDRVVKRRFVAGATPSVPVDFPVVPEDARPALRLLTRGAEVPSSAEVSANSRATSARLRAAEKVREAA